MSDYIPNPPNPERDPLKTTTAITKTIAAGATLVVGHPRGDRLGGGLDVLAGSPNERTDQRSCLRRSAR